MVSPNPFAPPESALFPGPSSGADLEGRGQYKLEDVLVHGREGVFAQRCVKCNAPTSGEQMKRALYWHPQWVYALLLLNVIIYAIVALIVRKSATVYVSLCPEHRQQRTRALIGGALGAIASIGACSVGVADGDSAALIGLGLIGLVAAAVYATVIGRVVYPVKIDDLWVHLKGVSHEYLASLPLWRG